MAGLNQNIELSEHITPEQFLYIHPQLMRMMAYVSNFCKENKITFKVTSLIRTEEFNTLLGSTSKTHVQGRACDFSLRKHHGWTYPLIQQLVTELNDEFNDVAAISRSTKLPRPIFVHKNADGEGIHAHLQVRP